MNVYIHILYNNKNNNNCLITIHFGIFEKIKVDTTVVMQYEEIKP